MGGETDFNYLSINFLYPNWQDWLVMSHCKELSAVAMFGLMDLLSGFLLSGILIGNKVLWCMSSLLVYAILRRARLGVFVSLLPALFLLFNFLSILCAYSFSTTFTNVFYLLSALYAWMAFLTEEDPSRLAFYWAWFLMATLLAFAARYEFLPVLTWAFLVGLCFFGAEKFRIASRAGKRTWLLILASTAFFLVGSWFWGIHLVPIADYSGPTLREPWTLRENLDAHLGRFNLAPLFGIPADWFSRIVAALFIAWAIGASLGRQPRRLSFLWWLMLGGWILYFGTVYLFIPHYPLQITRHHLYFFLPFVFLCAFCLEPILSLGTAPRIGPWVGALAAAIVGWYAYGNIQHVASLQGELRTHDREWQFLYKTRQEWPENCIVEYPLNDNRKGILKKYFPFWPTVHGGEALLAYRSPLHQVFVSTGQARADSVRDLESSYRLPFREDVFTHRFYTSWTGSEREVTDPIPVKLGFYYTDPASRPERIASKFTEQGNEAYMNGDYAGALKNCKSAIGADPWNIEAHQNCGVLHAMLGNPQSALGHFDRVLELAESSPSFERGDFLPEVLSSRASTLESLGRRVEGRADLAKALRLASKGWKRRDEALRRLKESPQTQ